MADEAEQRRALSPSTAIRAGSVVVDRALTLHPLRLLVPTAAFVITVLIVVPIGRSGDARFFQAAATIIVVLVLSLATQGHFFRLRTLPPPPTWIARRGSRVAAICVGSERLSAIGVLVYLGLGEGAALFALATNSGGTVLLGLSAGAIASAFFAIGTVALIGEAPSPSSGPQGSATDSHS